VDGSLEVVEVEYILLELREQQLTDDELDEVILLMVQQEQIELDEDEDDEVEIVEL